MANDNKRITELSNLSKLTGTEQLIIDNGDNAYKVTVDQLLGYIANKINNGNYPSTSETNNDIVLTDGEDLSAAERTDGVYYTEIDSMTETEKDYKQYSNNSDISIDVGLNMTDK